MSVNGGSQGQGGDPAEEYSKPEVSEIFGEVLLFSHQPLSVEDVCENRSCQGRPEAAREGASESVLEINSWEHCCMSYSLREGVCEVQSQVEGGAFSEGASVVTRPSRSRRSRRVLRV